MIRFGFKRKDKAGQKDAQLVQALGTRSIVMVGLMGCGKTAIGRRLAHRLSLSFVDADDEIEKAACKTIPEIFQDHGEAYFRNGERKVIARLLKGGPQVLATGGGAFMDVDTRQNVKQSGVSIWLKAELDVLMRRVMRRDNRPLLQNDDPQAVMQRLMEERYPIYAEADITIESREVSHDIVVTEILSKLSAYPSLGDKAPI